MYVLEVSNRLKKILEKLYKKDRRRYEIALKKINEILIDSYPFKSLRHDLKEFKRVHIDSHFVLIFRIDKKRKAVIFEDLDHHDNIYKSLNR